MKQLPMKYLTTIIALLIQFNLAAATKYVRTDGNNSNSGNANTAGGAWLTIDYAADHVSAGDIIRVQAGTYGEAVTPSVNGSSVNNKVTIIADGSVTFRGIDLNNNSNICFVGITLDTQAAGGTKRNGCVEMSGTNTAIEFWHSTFQNANANGIRCGVNGRLDKSLIVGNLVKDMGIGNGSGVAINLRGDDTLVYYNEITNSHPDAITMFGDRNRFVGTYVHGLSEASGGHSDVFQTGSGSNPDGWEQSVIEATFQIGLGNQGDEHTAQISYSQGASQPFTNNIFRRNVWNNISAGTVGINQTDSGPITDTSIYNNTTVQACRNSPTTRYGYTIYGAQTSNTFILNNIEYESWGSAVSNNLEAIYVTGFSNVDYNLAYDPDGTCTFITPFSTQAHKFENVNPYLTDVAGKDFRLGASSGAIGVGGPLTTVASASGTGTSFDVAQSFYFRSANSALTQYGGTMTVGDTITVGTDVLTISAISGSNITVTSSFTWAQNDPVYYGSDSTPDLGAYPYGAVDLSAAVLTSNGTTYTVTTTGDARAVCFFVDGVPYAWDSTAPFSTTIASGTVTARAYPLYAQPVTYVDATYTAPATIGAVVTMQVGTVYIH